MSHVSSDPRIPIPGMPAHDALAPLTDQAPNNRGFKAIIRPPKGPFAIGEPEGILRAPPNGCARAYPINVTLGLALEAPLANFIREQVFVLPMLRAVLKWGIGSQEFTAECDWLHGTQLSIEAEAVEVAARYVKNTLPWDPVPDDSGVFPNFIASAGVGYINIGRISSAATLTELAQLQNPDDQVDILIPPYATAFTVLPVSDASVAVEQMAFGTAYSTRHVIGVPLSNVGQYNVENGNRIWNGAQFLRVTNLNGEQGGQALALVVFCLAL
jgi:hypothetical protein